MQGRPPLRVTLVFASDEADGIVHRLVGAARTPDAPAPALLQGWPVAVPGARVVPAVPEIVERHPGCSSCALRWDLLREIPVLADRRHRPAHLLVRGDSTDDPATAVQTLVGDAEVAGQVRLDGLVVVVDATTLATRQAHGDPWAGTGHLLAQVRMADVLLAPGLDWLTESARWQAAEELRRWNAGASILHHLPTLAAARELLHQDAWTPATLGERRTPAPRQDQLRGCRTLVVAGEVDEDLLGGWVDHLHDLFGARLLRWSGTFPLARTDRVLHAQGVRSTVEVASARRPDGEVPASYVHIVADEVEAEVDPLQTTLDGCRA